MSRGTDVVADLRGLRRFGAADEAMLTEVARIIDRLDRLEAVASGDLAEWASIDYNSQPRRLVIDDVLGEARQQANTLRMIFAALKLTGLEAEVSKADGVDEIGAKRALRRSGAKVPGGPGRG